MTTAATSTILANLVSGPAAAIVLLEPTQVFAALVILAVAVTGLVAVQSLSKRPAEPTPPAEITYRRAA